MPVVWLVATDGIWFLTQYMQMQCTENASHHKNICDFSFFFALNDNFPKGAYSYGRIAALRNGREETDDLFGEIFGFV